MKKLLYLIVSVCILSACEYNENDPIRTPQSYISIYGGGDLRLWVSGGYCIKIAFDGTDYWAPEWGNSYEGNTEEQLKEFKRISIRNGDVNYYRETTHGDYLSRTAIADNFLSISVVSDADWDETHRAGTSLNDIFEFNCASYSAYIKSGYTNIFELENIAKKASLLVPKDMEIMSLKILNAPSLTALSNPTLDKNHKITVTIMTVDGEKKEASVDMEY